MNDVPKPLASAGVDPPAAFATALFSRAAREDLLRYEPRALARLATLAWQHLSEARPAGSAALRLIDPGDADPELAAITIIEVVNDDMPFLLDSTLAELAAQGLDLRLVAHPILTVERDADGRLVAFYPGVTAVQPTQRESLIHIHVARLADPTLAGKVTAALEAIYADIRVAVADLPAMRQSVLDAAAGLAVARSPLAADEVAEAVRFLQWLAVNNFTVLGLREFTLDQIVASTTGPAGGLGILRDPATNVLRNGADFVGVTPEMRDFLQKPLALLIIKADAISCIHRRTPFDCIIIKRFTADGQPRGELFLVGLFTSTAYNSSPQVIPYIRQKFDSVLAAAAVDSRSHSGRELINILESFPRDELFQIDAESLTQTALSIASLYERPRLRILARPDAFGRYVSILAFIPRDHYNTKVGERIADYFAETFDGRVAAIDPYFPEGTLVRVHYIISRSGGPTPQIERAELESSIVAIVRTWNDGLVEALRDAYGAGSRRIEARYGDAFSAAYMEAFGAPTALADIELLARLTAAEPLALVLYRPTGEPAQRVDMKLYSRGRPLPLSERVPLLEQMGFRVISERTFEIGAPAKPAEERVWLHDMALDSASGEAIDLDARSKKIEAAFTALFAGAAEPDGFNGLVLAVGMDWPDVALLRALSRYLRQIGITFSGGYIWNALLRNAAIAQQIVALFYARFDPDQAGGMAERAAREAAIEAEIDTALAAVSSLDEDRIIRRFRNLVGAAVRTNYFQRSANGQRPATIAFKFASAKIDDLPLPRPLYEISVYSPAVEAVHMRFGRIARGGIRWSDRAQDFRTEILGLAKAQQVKNAVIVPVGAKGGFVPKRLPLPTAREAWLAEGIAAYQLFIGSLLDLTDNIRGTEIIPPPRTVRHDGDDPYLVVAADKGTASFSDIANALSLARNYWLGDAFASGGSAGYDHKKMGITARGAFEAVKRHFREMDIDIDKERIDVIGVGDMSGDVFGNGVLMTRSLRLLAAFDHRDIFIDPDPDLAASYAERARLFALPRSSWQDYDRSVLSAGGGIYSRQAKQISLSAAARAMLGLTAPVLSPNELMQAILKARADLLWFGGIGTFVRSSGESDEAVADRANDAIRVGATSLNCRVIGEGANLGMTQLARIEAAERGIRLDTDAIDNSAGVNTSDVEVNIKIALAAPMREGRLDSAGRGELLAEMTGEVANRVLRNVYDQTLALSLAERRGAGDLPFAIRLMQWLERKGRLDRGVEYLASDAELTARARAGRGLTRPEIAILLAYAKLAVEDEILLSTVPDDPFFGRELARYFPAPIDARFPDAVATHPLRREIIATALANRLIDRGGPTIVVRVADETGADVASVVRAFALVVEGFALDELAAAIDALDNKVDGGVQLALYADVQNLLGSRLVWFIRNVDLDTSLAALAARFRDGTQSLLGIVETILPESNRKAFVARAAELGEAGVPEALARRIAGLGALASAPDIIITSERAGRPLAFVATAYFAADETFDLSSLAAAGRRVAVSDYYDRLALDRAVDQIERAHRRIAAEIIAGAPPDVSAGADAVAHWITARGADAVRVRAAVADIVAAGLTVSRLTVAASLLEDLIRT